MMSPHATWIPGNHSGPVCELCPPASSPANAPLELIAGEFTTYGLPCEPVAWQIVISVLSAAKDVPLGAAKAATARPTTTSQPRRRLARERVWAVIRYGPQDVRRCLGHDGSA